MTWWRQFARVAIAMAVCLAMVPHGHSSTAARSVWDACVSAAFRSDGPGAPAVLESATGAPTPQDNWITQVSVDETLRIMQAADVPDDGAGPATLRGHDERSRTSAVLFLTLGAVAIVALLVARSLIYARAVRRRLLAQFDAESALDAHAPTT